MESLIEIIGKSKKYRHIYKPTIERIIKDLSTRFPEKILEKKVKRKLHQIWGAYFSRPNFAKLTKRVKDRYKNGDNIKDIFREFLLLQTSTKERIPILNEFYCKIFEVTGIPRSIVEYGCGINALTHPWMNNSIIYQGYDVDKELIDFINSCFESVILSKYAKVSLGDILVDEYPKSDIYLLLKVLTLFEHQEKGVTLKILERIPSNTIVVSFPTRSLTGKNKGMKDFYRMNFLQLVHSKKWQIREILFDSEIVFVINK